MKKLLLLIFLIPAMLCSAQIDKDQLALAINKADEANTEQLKAFIWKRKADVYVENVLKLTTITEFSFNQAGELETKIIDSESSVKKKGGIRGMVQENAAEDKMDYVGKALDLSLAYTYMTKGQLIDFFGKATVTEKDGIIEATAENVYVEGDKLTVQVEAATNLFLNKKFSSLLGKDPVDGEVKYEKFSTGVNHGSTTLLNMPAQKMRIDAVNQDYSQRVQ
ncbi:MAG: hypothetical protein WAL94_14005 [Bacteroidales bacterium]|jgi:hypothetical protein